MGLLGGCQVCIYLMVTCQTQFAYHSMLSAVLTFFTNCRFLIVQKFLVHY